MDARRQPDDGIAVVIAAYNAAATLAEALESVAAQTLRPREVVVVDDGSTDATPVIARAHGARVISVPNGGAAAARNIGVRATTAPWIAFVDADDAWVADKLARQAARFADGPMSYTDAWIVEGAVEKRVSDIAICPSGRILEPLLLNNVITLSSVIVRRDVLLQAGGFPEGPRAVHDWPLWLRIAADHPILFIDQPLVRYRVSPTGISRNLEIMLPEHLAVLREAFADTGVAHPVRHLRARALAGAYAVVAHEAARASRWGIAASLSVRRLWMTPTDADAWRALIKVVLAVTGVRPW